MRGFEEQVAAIVGDKNVLVDDADKAPFLQDWLGKYRGKAVAVVKPATTQEVASVLAACRDSGVAVVPQGGNTSMSGGATPDATGASIVLSLTRMNKIRNVDPIGNTMTV